jgi:hypothetical protein
MLTPIHFDNEALFTADKINNERLYWRLPHELVAAQRASA